MAKSSFFIPEYYIIDKRIFCTNNIMIACHTIINIALHKVLLYKIHHLFQ